MMPGHTQGVCSAGCPQDRVMPLPCQCEALGSSPTAPLLLPPMPPLGYFLSGQTIVLPQALPSLTSILQFSHTRRYTVLSPTSWRAYCSCLLGLHCLKQKRHVLFLMLTVLPQDVRLTILFNRNFLPQPSEKALFAGMRDFPLNSRNYRAWLVPIRTHLLSTGAQL